MLQQLRRSNQIISKRPIKRLRKIESTVIKNGLLSKHGKKFILLRIFCCSVVIYGGGRTDEIC